MSRPARRLSVAAALPLACVLDMVFAGPASAHIKWFCAYDTAAPPLPFSQVFMLNFTTVAVAFGFLMFLAYATDVAIGG